MTKTLLKSECAHFSYIELIALDWSIVWNDPEEKIKEHVHIF